MLVNIGKKKKFQEKLDKQDYFQLDKIPSLKTFIEIVGLDKNKAQEILEKNKDRIEELTKRLCAGKGLNIKIGEKEYGFVHRSVSEEDIKTYVIKTILAEYVFGIEAELLLAIASGESNFLNPSNGDGYYQITRITKKELKKKGTFDKIKNKIIANKKSNILEKNLDEIYNKLTGFGLNNNFGSQTILACLVLYLKQIEKNPQDIIELLKAYNGGKYKDRYAQEVWTRYLYLKGEIYSEER
ncbi:MAG: lytic transglycosylase domain-containing protein [Candidatus Micrarchaeota archaeon]|nr:lytic transglycosylase domain-containing protein [Candidatus Micrarchaeota archaeon]